MLVHGGKKQMMCLRPALPFKFPCQRPAETAPGCRDSCPGQCGGTGRIGKRRTFCPAVLPWGPATAPYVTCITTSCRAADGMGSRRRSVVVVAVAAAAAGITTERVGDAACVHIPICMLYMRVIHVGMLAGWEHGLPLWGPIGWGNGMMMGEIWGEESEEGNNRRYILTLPSSLERERRPWGIVVYFLFPYMRA